MRRMFGILAFLFILNTGVARAQDAIDIQRVQIVNAPDVKTWASTARITSVSFTNGTTRVEFTKHRGSDSWPDQTTEGWGGPLQYTLWLFVKNGDQWAGSGFIQFWRDRDGSGSSADPDVPSVYDQHWYYAPRWAPVYGHGKIQPGEQIGFMVTAGNARDNSGPFAVRERSNIVLFAATDSGVVTFNDPVPPPTPTPAPPVPVPPQPQPTPVPVPQPGPAPSPLPATDLTPILDRLDRLIVLETDTNTQVTQLNKSFAETIGQAAKFVGKYIAPAIAAWLAAKKL